MILYRIVHDIKISNEDIISGEYAAKGIARWNSFGQKVVYTADSKHVAAHEKGFYTIAVEVERFNTLLARAPNAKASVSQKLASLKNVKCILATIDVPEDLIIRDFTVHPDLALAIPGLPFSLTQTEYRANAHIHKTRDFSALAQSKRIPGFKVKSARTHSDGCVILFPDNCPPGSIKVLNIEKIIFSAIPAKTASGLDQNEFDVQWKNCSDRISVLRL